MSKLKKLSNSVLNSKGHIDDIQKDIHAAYDGLNEEEAERLLLKHPEQLPDAVHHSNEILLTDEGAEDSGFEEIMESVENQKGTIAQHDIMNYHKFLKTADGQLLTSSPEHYAYDPAHTAFDRSKGKLYDYQRKFIEDWTVSAQEMAILYYGVGSGKTMVAVHCAEQYQEITKNAHVYFILPASLVIGTINEMYKVGIDAKRKNSKGEYIYYFISYQQLLNSDFEFKENSLLIIDEAHNLRNIVSGELSSVVNADRPLLTGTFSLIGNKLSQKLILNKHKFLRTIMMTGTLFVNDETDIDALIAIGYKKPPLLELDKKTLDIINNNNQKLFKIYYEGLIAFYRLSETDPRFPKKHYQIIDVPSADVVPVEGSDEYFRKSRSQGTVEKMDWLFEFLGSRQEERTLIYSQFKSAKIKPILKELRARGFKVGYISGELDQLEKTKVVKQYNTGEINVLIFTLSIKEGISFKETKNIIIIEPYWNYAIMEQIIARGIRANSHAEGQKFTIEIIFLIATPLKFLPGTKDWFEKAEHIMNHDIKTHVFPTKRVVNNKKSDEEEDKKKKEVKVKTPSPEITNLYLNFLNKTYKKVSAFVSQKLDDFENKKITLYGENTATKSIVEKKELGPFYTNYGCRDIDLFNRMVKKQESINIFEKKMLFSIPGFEKVSNNENSKFIEEFKQGLLDYAQTHGRPPTIKEERNMKEEIFDKICKSKANRKLVYDIEDHTATELFKNCYKIFKNLDIEKDQRQNVKILCPVLLNINRNPFVVGLQVLQTAYNFMIDVCGSHPTLDKKYISDDCNIKIYDVDMWNFINKYNYDYIFSFINTQETYLETKKKKVIKDKIEYSVYNSNDVKVAHYQMIIKFYNMLNTGGVAVLVIPIQLAKLIENPKELVGKPGAVAKNTLIFCKYIAFMRELDSSSVSIDTFDSTRSVIILKKLDGFAIKSGTEIRITNTRKKNKADDDIRLLKEAQEQMQRERAEQEERERRKISAENKIKKEESVSISISNKLTAKEEKALKLKMEKDAKTRKKLEEKELKAKIKEVGEKFKEVTKTTTRKRKTPEQKAAEEEEKVRKLEAKIEKAKEKAEKERLKEEKRLAKLKK